MNDDAPLVELFSSVQGEGPSVGRRQAFLRFHGCNLDCSYCDTVQPSPPAVFRVESSPGSGRFYDLPNPVSLETVAGILADWTVRHPGLHHSLSITGGEPLIYGDLLVRWLPVLTDILPIYLETNGTLPDALASVVSHVDYVSMDIKLQSSSGCQPLWDSHRRFLETAARSKVFVKVIVGPDTPSEEIERVCLIVKDVDPAIPLVIQPVTRDGAPAVPAHLLLGLQEQAARHLSDVRIIPQVHVFLNLL